MNLGLTNCRALGAAMNVKAQGQLWTLALTVMAGAPHTEHQSEDHTEVKPPFLRSFLERLTR